LGDEEESMADGNERSGEVEVRRGNLENARNRDEVALALDDEEGLTEERVRARQEAIGERRRYAGPVFEDVPMPAVDLLDEEIEVVEATVLDLTWAQDEEEEAETPEDEEGET
jgi:hypothetical protein